MALIDSITLMFRHGSRRLITVLLVTVTLAIAMPLLNYYVIYPAFTNLFISSITDEAQRLAHFSRPQSLRHTALTKEALSDHFYAEIYRLEHDFSLEKIRIYSAAGEIIYSTNPTEVGQTNTAPYFLEQVAKGTQHTELVTRENLSLEGETMSRDVIETYIPFMRKSRFLGAFEFYYDITRQMSRLHALILYSTVLATALSLSLFAVIALILKKEAAKNEAQDKAAELKEDVERITRHDLKSPLTSLLNGLEYLENFTTLDQDQASITADMRKAANEGINMINRSLDLYKMEVGSYQYAPGPVDLFAVVRRICSDLSGLADTTGAAVVLTLNGKPVTDSTQLEISADETLCYSMFANLLKNAIEASKAGDAITINVVDDDTIDLAIHNPAPVPEEIRNAFFEKYATTGKTTGTGLGTYSARLMAQTMGGLIAMHSTAKDGTTVTVTLPKIPTARRGEEKTDPSLPTQ